MRHWLKERKIKCKEWGKDFYSVPQDGPRNILYIGDKLYSFKIKMMGWHQLFNVSLALRALEELKIPVSPEVIKAISNAWLPARFELKEKEGITVVLDVLHNMESLVLFLENIKYYFPKRPIFAFFGLLKDKPWREMINLMREHFKALYFIKIKDKRAVPEEQIRKMGILPVKVGSFLFNDILEEIKLQNAVAVFLGSFSAVREAEKWLSGRNVK